MRKYVQEQYVDPKYSYARQTPKIQPQQARYVTRQTTECKTPCSPRLIKKIDSKSEVYYEYMPTTVSKQSTRSKLLSDPSLSYEQPPLPYYVVPVLYVPQKVLSNEEITPTNAFKQSRSYFANYVHQNKVQKESLMEDYEIPCISCKVNDENLYEKCQEYETTDEPAKNDADLDNDNYDPYYNTEYTISSTSVKEELDSPTVYEDVMDSSDYENVSSDLSKNYKARPRYKTYQEETKYDYPNTYTNVNTLKKSTQNYQYDRENNECCTLQKNSKVRSVQSQKTETYPESVNYTYGNLQHNKPTATGYSHISNFDPRTIRNVKKPRHPNYTLNTYYEEPTTPEYEDYTEEEPQNNTYEYCPSTAYETADPNIYYKNITKQTKKSNSFDYGQTYSSKYPTNYDNYPSDDHFSEENARLRPSVVRTRTEPDKSKLFKAFTNEQIQKMRMEYTNHLREKLKSQQYIEGNYTYEGQSKKMCTNPSLATTQRRRETKTPTKEENNSNLYYERTMDRQQNTRQDSDRLSFSDLTDDGAYVEHFPVRKKREVFYNESIYEDPLEEIEDETSNFARENIPKSVPSLVDVENNSGHNIHKAKNHKQSYKYIEDSLTSIETYSLTVIATDGGDQDENVKEPSGKVLHKSPKASQTTFEEKIVYSSEIVTVETVVESKSTQTIDCAASDTTSTSTQTDRLIKRFECPIPVDKEVHKIRIETRDIGMNSDTPIELRQPVIKPQERAPSFIQKPIKKPLKQYPVLDLKKAEKTEQAKSTCSQSTSCSPPGSLKPSTPPARWKRSKKKIS